MLTCTVTIYNTYGIHCRPATEIAQQAQKYASTITVNRDNEEPISADNALQLIGLGLTYGEQVSVTIDGPDEEEAQEALLQLFGKEFSYTPGQ